MATKTICFTFLLVTFICCFATAGNYRVGWTEEHIQVSTKGCVYGILEPQIEEFKRRLNYTGNGIPPELEAKLPMMKEGFEIMCRCISEQAAQRWSVQEYDRLTESEKQEFLMEVFCSKKCTPAFNAPIDCGGYSSADK